MITILLIIIIVSTLGPNTTDQENEHFKLKMKYYATQYNWKQSSGANKTSDLATKTWDSLQRLSCCGLDGPHDWDAVRPEELPDYFYPSSCCFFSSSSYSDYPKLCNSLKRTKGIDLDNPKMFRGGCLSHIRWLEDMNIFVHSLFVAVQLTLTILSAILTFNIKYCSRKKYSEQRNSISSINIEQVKNHSQESFPPQAAYNEAYVADDRC